MTRWWNLAPVFVFVLACEGSVPGGPGMQTDSSGLAAAGTDKRTGPIQKPDRLDVLPYVRDDDCCIGEPVIWGNDVVVAVPAEASGRPYRLLAMESRTGRIDKVVSLGIPTSFYSTPERPLLTGDLVVVRDVEGRVLAVDLNAGQVQWESPAGAARPLALSESSVLLEDGTLLALVDGTATTFALVEEDLFGPGFSIRKGENRISRTNWADPGRTVWSRAVGQAHRIIPGAREVILDREYGTVEILSAQTGESLATIQVEGTRPNDYYRDAHFLDAGVLVEDYVWQEQTEGGFPQDVSATMWVRDTGKIWRVRLPYHGPPAWSQAGSQVFRADPAGVTAFDLASGNTEWSFAISSDFALKYIGLEPIGEDSWNRVYPVAVGGNLWLLGGANLIGILRTIQSVNAK